MGSNTRIFQKVFKRKTRTIFDGQIPEITFCICKNPMSRIETLVA